MDKKELVEIIGWLETIETKASDIEDEAYHLRLKLERMNKRGEN